MSSKGRRRLQDAHDSGSATDDRRRGSDDRRETEAAQPTLPKAQGTVTHDDKGNAVWEWRVETPRRREDDPTIDFLKCLDLDGLTIEDEEKVSDDTINTFNPYSRG